MPNTVAGHAGKIIGAIEQLAKAGPGCFRISLAHCPNSVKSWCATGCHLTPFAWAEREFGDVIPRPVRCRELDIDPDRSGIGDTAHGKAPAMPQADEGVRCAARKYRRGTAIRGVFDPPGFVGA